MEPQAIGEWFHCKFFSFHFRWSFLKIERDSNLKENTLRNHKVISIVYTA